jgi:hypothetical protein
VRDTDELDAERPDLDATLLRLRFLELRRLEQAVLVEPGLGEAQRQSRSPHLGNAHLAQQERQRADVVLVRVREDDGPDPVAALGQVADVGQDQVDAEVLVARKREPRVDDDDLAVELEHGHVLADLADPAERDDAKRVSHQGILRAAPVATAAGFHLLVALVARL